MWLSFLFSLILTTLVGFAIPVIVCVLILVSLSLCTNLPYVGLLAETGYEQVWTFLRVFGDGSGSMGILTIGLSCGIVAFLFEALNFYRYQTLVHHPLASWLVHQKSGNFLSSHKGINNKR